MPFGAVDVEIVSIVGVRGRGQKKREKWSDNGLLSVPTYFYQMASIEPIDETVAFSNHQQGCPRVLRRANRLPVCDLGGLRDGMKFLKQFKTSGNSTTPEKHVDGGGLTLREPVVLAVLHLHALRSWFNCVSMFHDKSLELVQ